MCAVQVAKAILKEAVSGSKFAVEAVEQSDVAHITFQKVCPSLVSPAISSLLLSINIRV